MAHHTTTYTVISSLFDLENCPGPAEYTGSWRSLAEGYRRDGLWATQADEQAHDVLVEAAGRWAAHWLGSWTGDANRSDALNVGFTLRKTWGGGAGWALERGVEFTFSGLGPQDENLVTAFAQALRRREGQEAVVVLSRVETFKLT